MINRTSHLAQERRMLLVTQSAFLVMRLMHLHVLLFEVKLAVLNDNFYHIFLSKFISPS